MKTADLTATHLYHEVTIIGPDWHISGLLRRVGHGADEISDPALCEAEPTVMPGERWVDLHIGPFEFRARGDEEVEFS